MEGERNTTSHDQEELHVIGEEVGVAALQNSASDDSMGSNGSRCNGSLDKRHMFGVALLVIVDLIWVGSAGLTKVGTVEFVLPLGIKIHQCQTLHICI